MKKINRRSFLKACGAASALGLVAGCAQETTSVATDTTTSTSTAADSTATVEPVTIKVASWGVADSKSFTNVVDAFMAKNPNIGVEVIDITNDEYTEKLTIMLNGGTEVDAYVLKDVSEAPSLIAKGQIEDLTPYIERDAVDTSGYNGALETVTVDGFIIGMPVTSDYYVLYYNKDVFDAAGEPYPSDDMTWGEFEEIAKRITYGEGSEKVYGALLHTWNGLVMNWTFQSGEYDIMGPDYTHMKWAYEMALRMQNDDKTIMDYATLKTGSIHYSGPFLTGNIGMLPMTSGFMSVIIPKIADGESSINWGMSVIPHPDDTPAGYTVGGATPISMNPASEKKDAAWEFIKFMSGEDGALEYAKAGSLPGMTTDVVLDTLAEVEGVPEGAVDAYVVQHMVRDRPIVDGVAEVNTALTEVHDLIMIGEIGLDDGLVKMGEVVADILE